MKLRGNVDESGEGVFIFCIKFWVWALFNKFYCKNRLKAGVGVGRAAEKNRAGSCTHLNSSFKIK